MKKLKGFTLIELIIVIVIIGILAAITIIGYTSQAVKARDNSAYVGLTEAVKAANVCIANGDALNVRTLATIGGSTICAGTTAVSGNWPTLTNTGGNWKYADFTATGPSTAVVTNSIAASTVTIGSASTTATNPASTDHAVACTITGCTKYNF